MIPQLDPKLYAQAVAVNKAMRAFCKKLPGRTVTWKTGKFKGRKAEITDYVTWEYDWRTKKPEILVLVKTMRADGKDFMGSWDDYHRQYRNVYEHFE